MEEDGVSIIFQIIFIGFLTFLNAFFASAEMSMVSSNKNKISTLAKEGNNKAKKFLQISKDQTRFLSTIQFWITLAGFFSSASAATTISKYLGNYLSRYIPYANVISLFLVTLILSFLVLIFGELVPKRIALQHPERVALRTVNIINIASIIAHPCIKILSFCTILVLKILGKYSEDVEEKISEEELKSYIRVSYEQGVINSAGEEMIVNIMDFDDKMAYEVMTPRKNVYMIDYDKLGVSSINEILKEGHSRVPIYKNSNDNIIGVINLKDLFINYSKYNFKKINVDECLKEPFFVPETKKLDALLRNLQEYKHYMAILINEYGGFSGIVTMEDIVEEIVGEIKDEYDFNEPKIDKISDNVYVIDGSMSLADINEEIHTDLYSENHETISGLMIECLGFIPDKKNYKDVNVKYSNVLLKVLSVKDNMISKVELKILPKTDKID